MPNKPDDVIFDFFPYKTIQDIQDIFLSIKNQYDGFYVSGLIPLQAIKSSVKRARMPLSPTPPSMLKMFTRRCFTTL